MKCFKISQIVILLATFQNIKVTEAFNPFLDKSQIIDWKIIYTLTDELSDFKGKIVHKSLDEYVVTGDVTNKRVFVDRENKSSPYAVTTINYSKKEVTVEVLKGCKRFFSETGNSFYHACWERVFIEEGRMLLHASCIDTQYGGILFSGKSGIGKSTQSDLWVKYENAEVINGDRPILSHDDIWKAWGSPYAGSSKVHKNRSCDITCIVMLQQASTCSLRRLKIGEAFQKVFSQTTIYSWDKIFVEKVVDMVTALISEIPVYELSCTPDKNAVDILKEELERSENGR